MTGASYVRAERVVDAGRGVTRCLDRKLHTVRTRVHEGGMTSADTERALAPRLRVELLTAAQRLAGDPLAALRVRVRDVALMREIGTAGYTRTST